MSDNEAQTQEGQNHDVPPTAYITGADTGAGLVLVANLVREGYRVLGATTKGTVGAVAIRGMGGVPVYSELTRAESLKSDMAGAHVSVVVHLAPNVLNTTPHVFPEDGDSVFPFVASAEALVKASQEVASVTRLIAVSPAHLYGDTHGANVDESAHLAHNTALQKAGEKAEKAILSYENSVIVRAGYTLGAYNAGIIDLAQALKAGKRVAPSDATANWIHEDDLASAIIAIIKAQAPEKIYNAVSIHATPNQFADAFGEALGVGVTNKGVGFHFFGAPETPRSQLLAQSSVINADKLKALGWQPSYTNLAQAFDRTTLIWRAQEAPTDPVLTSDNTEIVSV